MRNLLVIGVAALALCDQGRAHWLSQIAPASVPGADFVDSIDTVAFSSAAQPLMHRHLVGTSSLSRPYSAWLAVAHPSHFHFALPRDRCGLRQLTTVTSAHHRCKYATNGAFFDMDQGNCIGNMITNGTVAQASSTSAVLFGLSASTHNFALGYLADVHASPAPLSDALNGRGWLVRNGTSYLKESASIEGISSSFILEEAPRTAVGIFRNGTIFLVEVDGQENIKTGMDLNELTALCLSLEALHCVNLDGGGSSVSTLDSKVISYPTCQDTSTKCERAVSSITCIV